MSAPAATPNGSQVDQVQLPPMQQSRTLPPPPPFHGQGRELPPPLHHRGPSAGMSISSILGTSPPPSHMQHSPPQPTSPHHVHRHRHHHHHHHHHPAPASETERAASPEQPVKTLPPTAPAAQPIQSQTQPQTQPEERPKTSPFSVGPTLPPVQYDPSNTSRRTAPPTPQPAPAQPVPAALPDLNKARPEEPAESAAPAAQQLPQSPPASGLETAVRAEDAIARVAKKVAAPSIPESMESGGSANSSVIGSPTLDGDKKKKRNSRSQSRAEEPTEKSPEPVYEDVPKLELKVDNTDVLKVAMAFPSYNLGSLIYSPTPDKPLLPRLEDRINSTIQIRIARRFLSRNTNTHVFRREVWGTDVYTDDSDIVAALYHCGYLPISDPGDCVVTLRILPLLEQYRGVYRNGIKSRSWLTRHDGVSFQIDKVAFVKNGKAEDRGWKMKKRRLEEWRISKDWREERYGGENIANASE